MALHNPMDLWSWFKGNGHGDLTHFAIRTASVLGSLGGVFDSGRKAIKS